MSKGIALCLLAALAMAGCEQPKAEAQKTDVKTASPQVARTGGDSANVKVLEHKGSADKATIEKLDKAYAEAKAAYEKSKDDKAKKDAFLKATMEAADGYMNGDVDMKIKYRQALKYYREALKTDPANAEAQSNINLIEGIYKDMGRPIPE